MPRVSKGTRVNRKTKPSELEGAFVAGFISRLDGRTELAKALKSRFDSIADDLGGERELSALKLSLLERLVWLEATLSRIEADLANTNDPKSASETLARWIQAVNSFTGLCKTLGLERKMRNSWDVVDYQRPTSPSPPPVNDAPAPQPQTEEAAP